jgi:tetratricopeptide (TPR) repeat protein
VEKQYETAMKRAQNQIDKTPNEALPRVWRAKIYRAQSDLPRAEADLLKATELDPALEMAYLLLADIYVTSGKPEQAIERLSAFAQKDRSVRALIQLALIHQRLGHFAAARDTYEKLLTVQPNSLLALNNLATLYSDHLKQPDMALTWARKAKELYPTEPHVADSLGWILLKRGDYGNALQLLRDSARQLSGRPEVQYHLGIAHYMLGEEEASRVALQQAIDSADEFEGKVEARRQLAILAIDVAKANVAVRAELENYLRERPADPVALFRLAELQERDGVEDQAIKTYEKIIDGNPLFAPAVRRAVLLYSKRSDDDKKAYELAQKARQAYPQDAEVAKALGLLSYRRELYPRAEELLREAVAKKENDWELLYYLGQTHFKLKQWKECQTLLGRAVAVNNTAPLANDARRTLAECSEMVSP